MEDKERGRGGKQMSKWIDLYFKKETERKLEWWIFCAQKGSERNTDMTVVFI